MAIIKQYHKDSKTTYVYDSQSYWDAEKGQSRSVRKLIGKLDPETGEIVPTGKRGRKKKEQTAEDLMQTEAKVEAAVAVHLEKIKQQELLIRQQQTQITQLKNRMVQLEEKISRAASILSAERK